MVILTEQKQHALLAPSSRAPRRPFQTARKLEQNTCREQNVPDHEECLCSENVSMSRRQLVQGLQTIPLCAIVSCQIPIREAQAASDGERRGIGRYIKKKKLDPLDTYVPAVIAAKNQLVRAGGLMKDNLQGARELLRNGAFDGLRDNIRAIGEYAEQGGKKDAKKLPDKFFLAVENFDFTLFQAKRNDTPVGTDSEKALTAAVESIESLLATVPQNILDDSAKIVEAVEGSFNAQPAAPKEGSDKQLDQLLQLVPN